MQDMDVILDFCDEVGGWTEASRYLSSETVKLTPGHVYNWYRRGRVAPLQRLNFLTVFNAIMPDDEQLPLSWLACPAAFNNGSESNGRAGRRTKEQAEGQGQGQAGRAKRRRERAGP